jgi:hypothetical protein
VKELTCFSPVFNRWLWESSAYLICIGEVARSEPALHTSVKAFYKSAGIRTSRMT